MANIHTIVRTFPGTLEIFWVYEGELKDGKQHGQGKINWNSGDMYVGEWKDGKRTGQGKYTYTSGDMYVGEWKDGKRNGQGKYTFTNGDTVEGIWNERDIGSELTKRELVFGGCKYTWSAYPGGSLEYPKQTFKHYPERKSWFKMRGLDEHMW